MRILEYEIIILNHHHNFVSSSVVTQTLILYDIRATRFNSHCTRKLKKMIKKSHCIKAHEKGAQVVGGVLEYKSIIINSHHNFRALM